MPSPSKPTGAPEGNQMGMLTTRGGRGVGCSLLISMGMAALLGAASYILPAIVCFHH